MKKTSFFILFLLGLVFISCKEKKEDQSSDNLTSTSLRFDWITNMNFVGDVVGARDFAENNGLNIKLEQAGMGIDPIRMVINGQNDFGITSYEQLLVANEKGAELVAIGIINHINPTVFLSLDTLNFNEPKDMSGKKVGINPGGATESIYRIFIKEHSVKNLQEIPTDYNITPFINGVYDIRLAFAFIEPIELNSNNISYSIIKPEDFGLLFPGRVYFTKAKTINENPQMVQNFINTMAAGWEEAINNKEKAITYLYDYDNTIDIEREKKSFDVGMYYFKGFNDKALSFDFEVLKNAAKKLQEIEAVKSFELSTALNSDFINNHYKK